MAVCFRVVMFRIFAGSARSCAAALTLYCLLQRVLLHRPAWELVARRKSRMQKWRPGACGLVLRPRCVTRKLCMYYICIYDPMGGLCRGGGGGGGGVVSAARPRAAAVKSAISDSFAALTAIAGAQSEVSSAMLIELVRVRTLLVDIARQLAPPIGSR